MKRSKSHWGLILPCLIWLVALAAALAGGYFKGHDLVSLWPLALMAVMPALITLLLAAWSRAEWAQIIIMFAWAGLAVLACMAFGFTPMALLFLCVPAIAMLFEREKVVEGLLIATILAVLIFYAGRQGYLPNTPITEVQSSWALPAGLMSTIALIISAMFSGAQSRSAASALPLSPHSPAQSQELADASTTKGLVGGVMDFGRKGQLTSANKAAFDLMHLHNARSEIYLHNLFKEDAAAQGHFDAQVSLMEQTQIAQRQRLSALINNDRRHFALQLSPLGDGKSRLHILDRGDEEARIQTFRHAQNDARQDSQDKTLFFAGVSHELRTPLNAIIGFSDMMRSRLFGPLPGKYAEYADLIHDSGQHMLDLLGDVLDLSKVEAGKYELKRDDFDAADVIRSSVKMIRPAADAAEVTMQVDLPENDPLLIQADRRAVRQILLNLLSNAVKFSGKGSRISVAANTLGSDLIMTVRDEGPGMSQAEIARIGEPYTQGTQGVMTTERGTGLGLSLVKSLIDLHKGELHIDSVIDVGTTVTIKLPLTPSL